MSRHPLFVALLFACFSIAYGLRCYSCYKDDSCYEPLSKMGQVECKDQLWCGKSIDAEGRVSRGCYPVQSHSQPECHKNEDGSTGCACNTGLCNGALAQLGPGWAPICSGLMFLVFFT